MNGRTGERDLLPGQVRSSPRRAPRQDASDPPSPFGQHGDAAGAEKKARLVDPDRGRRGSVARQSVEVSGVESNDKMSERLPGEKLEELHAEHDRDPGQDLGFTIRWQQSRRTGRHYPNVEPSAKARQKLHAAVRGQLNRYTTHQSAVATVRKVNQMVRGWSQYFHHGNSARVFGREQDWLRQRLRTWLWRKYDRTRSRWTFFTDERLHGQYGFYNLPTRAAYLR